jgi:hypothetical protein
MKNAAAWLKTCNDAEILKRLRDEDYRLRRERKVLTQVGFSEDWITRELQMDRADVRNSLQRLEEQNKVYESSLGVWYLGQKPVWGTR